MQKLRKNATLMCLRKDMRLAGMPKVITGMLSTPRLLLAIFIRNSRVVLLEIKFGLTCFLLDRQSVPSLSAGIRKVFDKVLLIVFVCEGLARLT